MIFLPGRIRSRSNLPTTDSIASRTTKGPNIQYQTIPKRDALKEILNHATHLRPEVWPLCTMPTTDRPRQYKMLQNFAHYQPHNDGAVESSYHIHNAKRNQKNYTII